ncbi:NUDIX hydrolase [Prochlorothrix hollandica]|uniref:Nudix hydrolase domain-containing protein n=1 Tax=Prochlorothrix hollandica PCC 9006 = CALU 1027 TaxID=317619 RepID=A0A0M2PVP6_PROHO|nr:NUDIX domain-containing protein [Prochlorothrix hollandica]KKI98436.1 hypothetical protein PROH_18440 [Prochlorothrix hollandica PCC 9006 = CALU 1027]
MNNQRIRPISICLFRNGNRILVCGDFDSVKQNYFCRPLGGGIEFWESSQEAMLREISEEISLEVENLNLVSVLENIFVYEGNQGHEIVFVYDGEFVDKAIYNSEEISGYEHETSTHFKAKWLSLDEIQERDMRLVPNGLTELIEKVIIQGSTGE